MFILAKILISTVIVLLLNEIAKRISPSFSGLISGLPLGTGLSVYFIAYQEGTSFMLEGIPWGIAGLTSSLFFCLTYLLSGSYLKNRNKITAILISSFSSIVAFLLTGWIIHSLHLTVFSSLLLFIIFFIVNLIIIHKLKISRQLPGLKKNSFCKNIFRAILVSLIILCITGTSGIFGTKWAGIFSAFPSTLFPLLILLHFEHNEKLYPSFIKGFSYGISTLAIFYLACFFLLPALGLNLGFLIVYIISLLYLFLLNRIKNYFIK